MSGQIQAASGLPRLQRVMAAAGWEVDHIDIDLTGSAPTLEVKLSRHDGRWLWARVDRLGRCTMETFKRERYLGMSRATKGRRPLSPQVDDVFIGRHRPEGPRAMLRLMTCYIADNAMHHVALADVRSAWAGVMQAPVRMLPAA